MSTEMLWNGVTMENPDGLFRLGTDSVVLADFASPVRGEAVCDLGCGSGAIALMLLANDPTLRLTGVELQPELAEFARKNAEKNGLSDRFRVLCGDLREYRSLLPAGSFTRAVSNPPYFPAGFPVSGDPRIAVSRSEKTCSPDELCAAAAWLLRTGGSFCLVHRPERLADLIFSLRSHHLEPKRLRFVRHRADSARSLLLLEAVRGGNAGMKIEDDLVLYLPDGSPTEDCRRIYHW